jgi:SAM-dependent methyltransferase
MPPAPARPQRFVFDEVAELYARVRPSYPSALIDDLIREARLQPGARVLELGAGPGNASVLFAGRGFRLTCLEPGAHLATILRERLASEPGATVVMTTFEAWPEEPHAFDLVFAAQSFHWIDPAVRFAKAARVLKPGGTLAIFANGPEHDISPAHDGIQAAYVAHGRSVGIPNWVRRDTTFEDLFVDQPAFEKPQSRSYPWRASYGTASYLDLLRTQSDHRLMEPEQLDRLLTAIAAAIDGCGGILEIEYTSVLTWSRLA